MNVVSKIKPQHEVLGAAFLNAGKELGMTQAELKSVIDRDHRSINRNGIEPDSKSGELALLMIRAYRSLFVMLGGNSLQMKHWMHTENRHTGGIPANQIQHIQGLLRVVEYLEAMCGET